jgi:hypothetical protein
MRHSRTTAICLLAVACIAPSCGCSPRKAKKEQATASSPRAEALQGPSGKRKAGGEQAVPKPAAVPGGGTPADLPAGLLVAYAQFEIGRDGRATAKPGPARLEMLSRKQGRWQVEVIEDPESNVMHKAMMYKPVSGPAGVLTFNGTEATGKFSRMRDAEVADVYGDGMPSVVVGTHDQGVAAVIRPNRQGRYTVIKLGAKPDTFIHEIEIGDLDGDGMLEVYATPSDPNRVDDSEQKGSVIRYIPKAKKGPDVVADLGKRHAKEILVGDVDGDGRDELYAAVEALTAKRGGAIRIVEPVEIRRYDAGTPPDRGAVVATLDDRFCRFLTAGDVDGDGRKEMVAAAFRSGVWLLRPPPPGEKGSWKVSSVDRDSSGFEHAAVLADLDGDGRDELYVAADDQGELHRYLWQKGAFRRETISGRAVPAAMMTWNIMPFTVAELSGE